MSEPAVADTIRQVVGTHHRCARWLSEDKTRTRCAIIDPILWALEWRTWDPSQCRPNVPARRGACLDYVMYDPHGNIAVAIVIGGPPHQRKRDRERTARLLTGMIHGVGVLTDGVYWEIYDLELRRRPFPSKMVESFTLDTGDPVELEDAYLALDYWLGKPQEADHGHPIEI